MDSDPPDRFHHNLLHGAVLLIPACLRASLLYFTISLRLYVFFVVEFYCVFVVLCIWD